MQIIASLPQTVSEKCDWIAFTVQFYKDIKWPIFITTNWKEIPPIARFTNGLENIQGVRVYWNSRRPQMGKHVILSGSVCTIIGENLKEFLSYVMTEEFSVTRLDLCVDIRHTNLNPANSSMHIKKGQKVTHARTFKIISSAVDRGYTQYVGTAGSATFVRIYDKASEMGTDFSWVRIEIVYGKRKTKNAIKAYLQDDNIRGMVRNFVDFPQWRKWVSVFDAPKVEVRYEHKTSNTREWLMGTVTKSVAKEMQLEDDNEFYLSFLQRIREEYYTLTKEEMIVDF